MAISTSNIRNKLKNAGSILANTTADLLANSDFINRSVGMANSYEDIMFIVQALGREPISLLGKDYLYIFDHVRRNYNMGTNVMDYNSNDCPKFTFYKEKPTVRFANPYDDPKNLLARWIPDMDFGDTSQRNILFSYAESDDERTDNKEIGTRYDIYNANPGVNKGGISSFANVMSNCDLLKKTNDNFNHGKYRTLIARFHTNSMDSKDKNDITQTAITEKYGMSHGRNLLKTKRSEENGYENPYCRTWTYHHQYNQLARAIRPFELESADMLELAETTTGFKTVGFRTVEDKTFGFDGGSERLDKYGVLNYKNGMVNIAPTAKIKDYFEHKEDKQIPIKKCMFSIENLAWKSENIIHDEYDQYGLSPEQKGPLGGRIMWFPPYDLTFSEDVTVNWNSNQFIGRGEKVYTYTDTERRGNLSFTLLIDHPSILDYWTGHERNGMENQGSKLIPGNGGGVDEINNQENTLLRFFAGCEILSAKPQEFRTRNRKPNNTDDVKDSTKKDPAEPEVAKSDGKKILYCFVFFPNNYSGMDDVPTKNSGKVNAIEYLLNGIGTQRVFNETTKKGEDFGVDMTTLPYGNYGGYEMQNGDRGISITKEKLSSLEAIDETYNGATEYVQFLTDKDGNKYVVPEGDLTKYSWDGALSHSQAEAEDGSINNHWYDYRYYYRVDSNTLPQNLIKAESYIDSTSNQYNTHGIYGAAEELKKQFPDLDLENGELISLSDMYVALVGDPGIFTKNRGKIDLVQKLKNNVNEYKITNVTFYGNASVQGNNPSSSVNTKRNSKLAKQRGLTFKLWLNDKLPNIGNAECKESSSVQKGGDRLNVNDPITKLWRSAYVKIEYEKGNFELAATAESIKGDENGEANTDRLSIPNNQLSLTPLEPTSIYDSKKSEDDWVKENQKTVDDSIKEFGYVLKGQSNGKEYFDKMSWDYDPEYHESIGEATINGIKKGTVERYDNEGEFFELLEKNDPFLHHLITDKIKYFDPAFHSISPEGFNARLTFLHQCTRQGSTVSNSDKAPGTAYNLAFGRPPICVLRLGDFYYTKIVINNISIQYENAQWDLNPEGIGVMPMFAKISMNFAFLGGSDLAGPISRLQNAVSFNYYANTGVYDNRAEMVQYDLDGNGHEVKFKPFSYPDMVHDGIDKYRKKGVIDVGTTQVSEFNRRTTNLNQGVNGEIYNYKTDQNGNIIK